MDTATGNLMFDADGSGASAAIVLVSFSGNTSSFLTHQDIFIAV